VQNCTLVIGRFAPVDRSVVENILDFRVDAVAKVASVSVAGGQKLARLFCRLGLDAPFLDAGHNHIGVE
jgi:hypothetical protein